MAGYVRARVPTNEEVKVLAVTSQQKVKTI